MGDVSVILSFAHPLATVFLTTLWTLHILKEDYSQALEEVQTVPEQDQRKASQGQSE